MHTSETLDHITLEQFKRDVMNCIPHGFFDNKAPGAYSAIARADSISELLGAISAFLEVAEPGDDDADQSDYDRSVYRTRYNNASQGLTPIVDIIRNYAGESPKGEYPVRVMNEEELSDELDRRRAGILQFIAVRRYERRAPGGREAIARAGSLGSLSRLTKDFIEKVRPKEGEVIIDPDRGVDGTTAELSVFHVLIKNLTPLLNDLDNFRKGIVELEDEREC